MSRHLRGGKEFVSLLICCCIAILYIAAMAQEQDCIACHEQQSPGIVAQWKESRHGEIGITCEYCHEAGDDEPDGFEHHGQRISVIVSPKDCSQCHQDEFDQQKGSHHARAPADTGFLSEPL